MDKILNEEETQLIKFALQIAITESSNDLETTMKMSKLLHELNGNIKLNENSISK
jgi:hypothetical protein